MGLLKKLLGKGPVADVAETMAEAAADRATGGLYGIAADAVQKVKAKRRLKRKAD